jgi:hypothetical protein
MVVCGVRVQLIFDRFLSISELHKLAWSEAKNLAIQAEGRRQAVVVKLQSYARMKKVQRWYAMVIKKIIRIQAVWRRAIGRWHHKLRMGYFEEVRPFAPLYLRTRCLTWLYPLVRRTVAYGSVTCRA